MKLEHTTPHFTGAARRADLVRDRINLAVVRNLPVKGPEIVPTTIRTCHTDSLHETYRDGGTLIVIVGNRLLLAVFPQTVWSKTAVVAWISYFNI